ncbi:MAG: PorV/PorQ family protein [Candidatus Eisenbacteria bacterium]
MKRTLAVISVAVLLAAPAVVHAEDGTSGLAFLKLGAGARAIGVGDAYTAVAGDASSIYWNPAGTVAVENIDVVLMHSEWFEGIRYEYLGGVRSDGTQAFGVAVVGLYMDDLERREGPTSEPIGHFGVFDFAVMGTYGRKLTEYLDVGAGAKYLFEKIDDESATGFAADLGVRYVIPSLPGMSAGASVQNLGPGMTFIEDEFSLPLTYRVGVALESPIDALKGELLLTGDAVIPNDGDPKYHFGAEFEYSNLLALRFGYRTGWDNQNVSVGLGAKVGSFRLDYAYVPFYSDLGDTHRMSLGFSL